MRTSFGKLLKRYFTTGLLALLPVAASVWVIVWLFRWVDGIAIRPLFQAVWIQALVGRLPQIAQPWVERLLGIIILFFGISALGLLTTNVVGRWFLSWLDAFMKKVPLASAVYSFVKGLIENLRVVGPGCFQNVVLVEFPRKGVWSMGFVTRTIKSPFASSVPGNMLAVFVPTSPNPATGFILLIDSSDVIQLDISLEDGLKFIMSGGVLMPGLGEETGPV